MKHYFVFVFCALLLSCKSDSKEIVKNQSRGGVFGTSYSIVYFAEDTLDYQKEIDSVFAVVNNSLSTYIPTSDISKINQGDTTVLVDHMFKEVFMLSREIYKKSNGYFDPTVGTLVNAYGFGPGEQITMDSTKLDSLMYYVGFNKVDITPNNTVSKEDAAIYFDFNAIAKGYAIDRVATLLDTRGVRDYLIEIGGELVAKGKNKIKNKPWVVGIDNPENEQERELKLIIKLENRALASSGNYRKFRIDQKTGERYVHTIDPTTGFAKNSKTLGVTVLANDCATADGYATAFMAMELEAAKKVILANNSLDGYIIYLDEKDNVQEFITEGFKQLIVQ